MEVKIKKSVVKKVLVLSSVTLLLFYTLYQTYKFVMHEVKTEPVAMYTLKDSIKTKGIIVRNEELVYWDENGTLMNVLEDGAKVSRGGKIAEIYHDEKQASCMVELKELDEQINQLKRLNVSSGMSLRGPDYIDKQINEEIRNINLFGKTARYKEFCQAKDRAKYLLNERHVVMGTTDNFYKRFDELENRRKELIKECGSSIGEVLAENSGYFVSNFDGYENYLNYDDVKNLKAGDVNFDIQPSNKSQNNVAGKIIKSVDWYIISKMSEDDSMRFKVGENVNVEINSAFNENVPCKVVSVNKEEGASEVVVVLSCDRMSKELSMIRSENIEININTYTGLTVNKSALKESVVSKTVNKDGEKETLEKKVKGVYIKYGSNLLFKEVVPIYMDSSCIICKSNPTEEELFSDDTIQIGDEVVVEGTNLYDGKHIE